MKTSELDKLALADLNEGTYNSHPGLQLRSTVLNIAITIGIIILATLLSFLFRYIGFHETNIIIAYILGVLLVAKQTDGYFYGILASVLGVLTFNFFFTEPYYTLYVYSLIIR